MINKDLADEWMNRAYSNLERASMGRPSKSVYFEDLCYDCQQAVEKSLKALLIFNNVQFPYVHTISKLLEIIEAHNVVIPHEVMEAIILSDYAVATRYPGDYEPVGEEEYLRALEIARSVCKWVAGLIR